MRRPLHSRVRRLLLAGSSVLLAASVGSATTLAAQDTQETRGRDTSFTIARGALIDITVRSGLLVVRGSDRTAGELRTNNSRYELRSTGVGVTLSTRESGGRAYSRDTEDARVELLVPRGVKVVVSAQSADVDVRDVDGDVEVRTTSGDIMLARLANRAIVESLSGDLTIEGGVGDLRVTTASGDVMVRGLRGDADVHTTSGDVSLIESRTSRVSVESISGDVDLDGTLGTEARVQIATHSGDVALHVPGAMRGALQFETYTGEMTTSGSLLLLGPSGMAGSPSRRERTAQRFEFGGGGGGAVITVSTFNGDLRFVRSGSRSPD